MKLDIVKGATSVLCRVFIQDSSSTTGAGLAGLVYNTSGMTCYQMRDDDGNAGATAVALVTATLGTWTSKGFKEKDATHAPGWYKFGIPNAALAAGSRSVGFHFQGATNMAPLAIEIELTGWDNQDGVRGGMTALPNAAANAAGGLPVSAAGGLDLDEMNVDIEAIQTSTAGLTYTVANQVDANVLDWKSATAPAMTGDAFARLGAPAGASVSADVASVKTSVGAVTGAVGSVTGAVGSVGTGGIAAASFAANAIDSAAIASTGANEIATALLDLTDGTETGFTVRQALRLILSACAAKLAGAGTGTITIRNVTDSADRIVATTDALGNRSAVTLTP